MFVNFPDLFLQQEDLEHYTEMIASYLTQLCSLAECMRSNILNETEIRSQLNQIKGQLGTERELMNKLSNMLASSLEQYQNTENNIVARFETKKIDKSLQERHAYNELAYQYTIGSGYLAFSTYDMEQEETSWWEKLKAGINFIVGVGVSMLRNDIEGLQDLYGLLLRPFPTSYNIYTQSVNDAREAVDGFIVENFVTDDVNYYKGYVVGDLISNAKNTVGTKIGGGITGFGTGMIGLGTVKTASLVGSPEGVVTVGIGTAVFAGGALIATVSASGGNAAKRNLDKDRAKLEEAQDSSNEGGSSSVKDLIINSENAKKWGVLEDGTNQGAKHFTDYWDKYPERIPSLEQRLGVTSGEFNNSLDGFNNFSNQAERVISEATTHGNVRHINGKSIYYIDGATNVKKGVVVIVKDGKIQSMMPSDIKSFNKLQ